MCLFYYEYGYLPSPKHSRYHDDYHMVHLYTNTTIIIQNTMQCIIYTHTHTHIVTNPVHLFRSKYNPGSSMMVVMVNNVFMSMGLNVSVSVGLNMSVSVGLNMSVSVRLNMSMSVGLNMSMSVGLNMSVSVGLNMSVSVGLNMSVSVGLNMSMSVRLNMSMSVVMVTYVMCYICTVSSILSLVMFLICTNLYILL